MSLHINCCSSFANDDALAHCSPDGILHVWDIETGERKQQYTPASHLAATFTCLSWKIPHHRNKEDVVSTKKRRKSKPIKPIGVNEDKIEYIALGTVVGDVMLFNCLNGELALKYGGGHTNQVNSIAWKDDTCFYSCSNDQHIVEWNTTTTTHQCKWKAEKHEVYSILVGPCSKTILSAGKAIKLWDLKTKELLRRFTGHTTPVISLSFINLPEILTKQSGNPLENLNGRYFLSAASDDRIVSAWQVKDPKHKKMSLCSFLLPSEPKSIDILSPSNGDSPTHLLALTQDNEIIIFTHALNGPIRKPLNPTRKIKVVTEDVEVLNIINAKFKMNCQSDPTIIIAYGSEVKVMFEAVNLKENSSNDIVLIRKDPKKSDIFLEQNKTKLREPIKNKNTTSIAPGVLGHSGSEKISGKKRKKVPSIGESELTMEERLNALSVDCPPTSVTSDMAPRADSFAQLLAQGLQSNDRDVLNQVLQHGSDTLITNTVKQLSIQYVIPLIRELTERLQGSPEKCLIFVKWMRAALSHHTSYLTTFPDVVSLLSGLYQLMNTRIKTHGKLSKLEGKLDLIMSQISTRKDNETGGGGKQEALFVFEEEFSDEHDDMIIDGITIDPSSSYDEWEDLSDAGNPMQETDVLMDEDG